MHFKSTHLLLLSFYFRSTYLLKTNDMFFLYILWKWMSTSTRMARVTTRCWGGCTSRGPCRAPPARTRRAAGRAAAAARRQRTTTTWRRTARPGTAAWAATASRASRPRSSANCFILVLHTIHRFHNRFSQSWRRPFNVKAFSVIVKSLGTFR